jgi:hypothetical protein
MMEPHSDWEITLTMCVVSVPDCPDGQSPLTCLNCRNALDIHQPDGDLPERMLATCPHCRAWHVIECGPGPGALIVLLPDSTSFRKAPKSGSPMETTPR